MKALDVPVHNISGLRPAVVGGTKEIAPLTAIRDLDTPRLLDDVTMFNFHPAPAATTNSPRRKATDYGSSDAQRVDPNRPHPFTAAGNTEINALIRMPPAAQRAGDIVLIDSDLHHPVRRHRQPSQPLAQPRHNEMTFQRPPLDAMK